MRRAAYLIAVMCLAAACQSPPVGQWQTFCVDADAHAFKPAALILGHEKVITYQWEFSTSMRYNLGNGDQCDWNKLHGVSWQLLTNHEDALMVAWRWNLDGFWQIAGYYHDEGTTRWAGATCTEPTAFETDPAIPVVEVYPDADGYGHFETHMNFQPNGFAALTIITPGATVFYEHYFGIESDNRYREIGPWFGGNNPAPHAMCLARKRIE